MSAKRAPDTLGPAVQAAIAFAREEAVALNHNYIGTEHLLLGVMRETDGAGGKTLATLGIGPGQTREAIRAAIGGGEAPVTGEIGMTPRAREAVKAALKEARRARSPSAGTDHLLSSLLRRDEGMAAIVLTKLGVSPDRVRAALVSEGAAPPEDGGPRSNVVMCRLDDASLGALDTLIEAGIRSTRSDAASWLIRSGIEANEGLFSTIEGTVAQIRKLREDAKALAERAASTPPGSDTPA